MVRKDQLWENLSEEEKEKILEDCKCNNWDKYKDWLKEINASWSAEDEVVEGDWKNFLPETFKSSKNNKSGEGSDG